MIMMDGDKEIQADIGDEENLPVEVELSDEDLSTAESVADEDAVAKAEAAKAAATAEKQKNRVPANKRINALTREKMEALEYAQKLERERDEWRQKATQNEQRASQSDRAAFANYERAVEVSLAAAKRNYSEAAASGDPEKMAEANIELNKWASEKTEIERFKARQPKQDAQAEQQRGEHVPEQQEQRQRQQAPQLAPEAQKWATETTWFNPESDEFDPLLHKVAVNYAAVIEAEYIENGRADEIGRSAEYFKEIEDFVQAKYPDRFANIVDLEKPNGAKVPAMNGGRPDTAPVGRSASNGGISGTPSTKVQLSAEEKDMVKRYMTQGLIRDHKTGKPIKDFGEAMKSYALTKWKTEQADRARQ